MEEVGRVVTSLELAQTLELLRSVRLEDSIGAFLPEEVHVDASCRVLAHRGPQVTRPPDVPVRTSGLPARVDVEDERRIAVRVGRVLGRHRRDRGAEPGELDVGQR